MARIENPNYRLGEFVLDVRERRLTGVDQDIYLPPKTFQTLLYLVIRSGQLVTKQELLDAVWQDTAVTENALTRCIKEVRVALRDNVRQPRFIETVPRVGYKFIADVAAVPPIGLGKPTAAETEAAGDQGTDRQEDDAAGGKTAGNVGVPGATERRAIPEPPSRRTGPGWLRRHALLGGIIVVSMAVLVWAPYLINVRSRTFPFRARDFILITDLDNQSGNPVFDRSLTTAFTVSMEQSIYANVFPRARVGNTLQRMGKTPEQRIDEEVGREICLREKIRGLISLGIVKIGQQYSLSARLIDPQSGDAVRSHVVNAQNQDRILSSLQSLATEVRGDLGESLSSIGQSNLDLMRVTTSSLNALKFYSDGIALWEKGQYRAAVQLYQSAIREDSGFAMAHEALGIAYCSHVFSDPVKGKEHYEQALRLSEHVTERERLAIRMTCESDLGHFETAQGLFEGYLRTYPDDFRVRYSFGHLLMMNNQLEKAIRQFLEVLRLAPDHAGAHINIATCCWQVERFAEALGYYAAAFKLEPTWETNGNLNHEYGFTLVKAGDLEKAREVFNRSLSTENKPLALRSLALLDMYQGKYRQAKARLDEAISLNRASKAGLSEARNHLILSMLLEGQGRRIEAAGELGKAAKSFEASGSVAWLAARIGIAYVRAGDVRQAGRLLDVAQKKTDMNSPEQMSDLHRLEAELQLARGNRREALRLFVLADNEFHTAFSVEGLARAYWLTADTDRGIAALERFLAMKGRSLGLEPQQQWIEAHYRLARMFLSRGEKQSGKELLDALLRIWKDADPDLPLLRDAVRLAAELAGSVSS